MIFCTSYERRQQDSDMAQYFFDGFRGRVRGQANRHVCHRVFLKQFGKSQGWLATATVLHMMCPKLQMFKEDSDNAMTWRGAGKMTEEFLGDVMIENTAFEPPLKETMVQMAHDI
eukprot:s3915_g7.t1